MKTNKDNTFFGKPAMAFVAVVLCLSLSTTVLAATGALKGFFQDITNRNGAVVGTSYEQATSEIDMSINVKGDELIVTAILVNPQTAPYSEVEKMGIAAYRIADIDGKVVAEGAVEATEIVDEQLTFILGIDDIESGSYKLMVSAFVAESKAEQPLNINGNWECTFTK